MSISGLFSRQHAQMITHNPAPFYANHTKDQLGVLFGSAVLVTGTFAMFATALPITFSACLMGGGALFAINALSRSVLFRRTVYGSGILTTKTFALAGKHIEEVHLCHQGHLVIKQGPRASLRITADDNIVDILTTIEGKSLVLMPRNYRLQNHHPIKYELTIPNMNALSAAGDGSIVMPQWKTKALQCSIIGSGSVKIEAGKILEQEIRIAGSGSYDASNVSTENTKLHVSGSGDAKVHVRDTLDVRVSGSATCLYRGHPHINRQIAGTVDIKPMKTSFLSGLFT